MRCAILSIASVGRGRAAGRPRYLDLRIRQPGRATGRHGLCYCEEPVRWFECPSGSVTYSILNCSNTSVSSGTVTLTAGIGSSTTIVSIPGTLVPGTYTININYTGDANYQSAPFTVSLTVGKLASSVSVPSQPVALSSGRAGTVAITVRSKVSGSDAPSGSVSYSIPNSSSASVSSGTAVLTAGSGTSASTLAIPGTLAAGTYTINANYTGDATYSPASTTVSLTVSNPASSVSSCPRRTLPP
jgi:Bacterial Ig-like domain (group 3)